MTKRNRTPWHSRQTVADIGITSVTAPKSIGYHSKKQPFISFACPSRLAGARHTEFGAIPGHDITRIANTKNML